jgi:hypothetical protein
MTYTTIDSIVREKLLQNGLTIHWYVRFLSFALECLKELNLDTLPRIKTVRLPVDRFGSIKLPCDYINYVRVGRQEGRYLKEVASNSTFTRLLEDNSVGTLTAYDEATSTYYDDYLININEHGEHLGRFFGMGEGSRGDVFKEIPEDNRMAMGADFSEGDIVEMDYLYFGAADSSTPVHHYAVSTISAYVQWRYYSHLPKSTPFDKQNSERQFWNNNRILRARRFSVPIIDYIRILRSNFKQTPKL